MIHKLALGLVPLLALVPQAHAQEKKAATGPTYKVDVRIRDGSDAASRNGRRYTMLIDAGGRGTFRVGERVPVATGSFQPGAAGASPLVNTQFTYLDTGVNIDSRLQEDNGKVLLSSTVDISMIVEHKQPGTQILPNPTVAQVRLDVNATLVPGKPAVVASIDDPVTQRKLEVEATVTRAD